MVVAIAVVTRIFVRIGCVSAVSALVGCVAVVVSFARIAVISRVGIFGRTALIVSVFRLVRASVFA